jgi:CTP synthase (UTP-ammonia lyase)
MPTVTLALQIRVHSLYQVVPHITDEIQEWIERVAMNPVDGTEEPADVCVIELGGTIGKKNILYRCRKSQKNIY